MRKEDVGDGSVELSRPHNPDDDHQAAANLVLKICDFGLSRLLAGVVRRQLRERSCDASVRESPLPWSPKALSPRFSPRTTAVDARHTPTEVDVAASPTSLCLPSSAVNDEAAAHDQPSACDRGHWLPSQALRAHCPSRVLDMALTVPTAREEAASHLQPLLQAQPPPLPPPSAAVASSTPSRASSPWMTANLGTAHWMAPEVMILPGEARDSSASLAGQAEYSEAADVYSCGLLLWAIGMGRSPFDEIHRTVEVFRAVKSGVRPPVPDEAISTEPLAVWFGLAAECWLHEAEERPTMEQVYWVLEAISLDSLPAEGRGGGAQLHEQTL
eukprot:4107276-Prymnesium_polylepis.1